MPDGQNPLGFQTLNRAYNTVFRPDRLSLGLTVPLDAYAVGALPDMEAHLERARLADALGFSALWLRDVPFNVPSFGDPGQMFDPFVYLGALAVATQTIALGAASIVLPLRHPAHVAKAAASADRLSGGRLLLGVASGDRPEEYPALNVPFGERGARFRDSLAYIRAAGAPYSSHTGTYGALTGGMDLLPKPVAGRIPLLITGGSQQSPDWVAAHGDGWMTYPRAPGAQAHAVAAYRGRVSEGGGPDKPVMQSLYIDLQADRQAPAQPIHLGFRSGIDALTRHLRDLQMSGINHVALNLRFNGAPIEDTMNRLADALLPEFGT
ncbi:MAG: LLM class oxidoreductase [Pseudomonadota bacterium]